jgi:hypothetical protein
MRVKSRIALAISGKFGYLLAALIALMLSIPLLIDGRVWSMVLSLFAGAVLVAGLYAARPGRRSLALGLILALADFGIGRLAEHLDNRWFVLAQILLWLATSLYVTAVIFDAIFESETVGIETLQAAFCVYLLMGLAWVYAYALVELAMPGSFMAQDGPQVVWTDSQSRRSVLVNLFTFSYATLTGSGYGDLRPSPGFASLFASLEAMLGQIYLAVVIARLVAIQSSAPPPGRSGT